MEACFDCLWLYLDQVYSIAVDCLTQTFDACLIEFTLVKWDLLSLDVWELGLGGGNAAW